jgi:ABC-type multidrug transport system fused ATPase/permease subunit
MSSVASSHRLNWRLLIRYLRPYRWRMGLMAGRTGITVAHRLSTNSLADDILIMEQGQVLESGPRLELAADPTTHYAAMLRPAATEVCA